MLLLVKVIAIFETVKTIASMTESINSPDNMIIKLAAIKLEPLKLDTSLEGSLSIYKPIRLKFVINNASLTYYYFFMTKRYYTNK